MSTKHASFDDYGVLAFGDVLSTYVTLLTPTDDADFLMIFNTLNTDVILEVPSKNERSATYTTKEIYVTAGTPFVLDFRAGVKRLAKGLIRVKYFSGAPTSGSIAATVMR